eukprot:278053-Prymnesium_polylepis.1
MNGRACGFFAKLEVRRARPPRARPRPASARGGWETRAEADGRPVVRLRITFLPAMLAIRPPQIGSSGCGSPPR